MQPISQSVNLLESVSFTCNAAGYNVTYEWTANQHSIPSKVIGMHTDTLVIPNVISSDSQRYRCVARNKGGTVSSQPFGLTVTGMLLLLDTICSVKVLLVLQVYQK